MLTEQQRLALDAATKVLQMAGIAAWFEARIIKDSDKKLNGRRISSKRRTDLDSVLAVAESKRVGMLPDMRMELRMYATAASSRTVIMGHEQAASGIPKGVTRDLRAGKTVTLKVPGHADDFVQGTAHYSPSKNVERLIAEGAPEHLVHQAQSRVPGFDAMVRDTFQIPDAPLARMRTVAEHTCDAAGPMRQREPGGPFLSTCSHCGEINDDT